MNTFSTREFRDALGRFVTGVTVVTTLSDTGPLGMTVNSFASLSLDPPLVLWSPARKSSRFPAFEAAPYFAIHVLGAAQRDLAEHFARIGDMPPGLAYAEGPGGVPLLDGMVARFECRHAAGHDGGDHLIVVGEVLRITTADIAPLVFDRGAFVTLPE